KFMKRIILLLSFFPVLLFSSDSSQVEFLGFSADGKFAGILEFGTHDGSGFPWAKINFIDVRKNDFAGKEIKIELDSGDEKNTEEQAKKKALDLLDNAREKAKIPVLAGKGAMSIAGSPFHVSGKVYNVSISTKSVKQSNLNCQDPFEPKLLKVVVSEGDQVRLILQDDRKVPGSRGCAFSYTLDKIFIFQKGIVVFVQFSRPGFEGSDNRYLAVTGMLP
ncbi:MAG: DUF2259 domain-containing protein, partial [Leptospira sp.]|nr:DUF2259 domain-containing protein [Leptospira sp.]